MGAVADKPMRWLLAVLLGLLLAGLASGARAALSVSLVLSEPGGIYLQAADALRAELASTLGPAGGGYRLQQRLADEAATERPDLIVAIGVRALRQVLRGAGDTPVLALLVPRLAYVSLLRESGQAQRASTALFLEQPYARQLRLPRVAVPGVRRVGVILGPATAALAGPLEAAAEQVTLEIRRIDGPDGLFPALDELAGRVDVLLLVPDAAVVGRATLPSLLLQTYRRRLPVIGYSEALAQAGALLSLYATPVQMGAEAGRLIRDLPAGPIRLPAPHYPSQFSLRINHSVARSLGIDLPDEASLRAMTAGEGTP